MNRFTRTRCPTSRVGSIDSEGIWYGLTMKAWIPSARPSASTTMMTSSRSAPWVLWGRGILSLLPRRGRRSPWACLRLRLRLRRLPTIRLRLLILRGLLLAFGALLLGGLDDLSLGLADGDALGVDGLGVLLRDDHLVLDAPAALGDPGALADLLAQVVELRPPHIAAGGNLQLLDLRRVQRERSLHADPEGLLPHGECLSRPTALALDHDALEDLGAPPVALDHLEVNAHAIPGVEPGTLLERSLLEVVDDGAHGGGDGGRWI